MRTCRSAGTLADDLLEVVLGPDFVLEIQLLFVQLFLQLRDFPVRKAVFHGDRNLLRHLAQELDFLLSERLFAKPSDVDGPQNPVVREQRNTAERFHAFGEQMLRDFRLGR